jgi:heterodisulfide reductase subunit C
MPARQSYGRQRPDTLEHAQATVEGVELPGHWNRMFGPRVITDYDPAALDEITALPGAESMGYCYQCAKCVGVCPVDIVGD